MKDYKRLTERRGGLIIDNCGNCPNVNNKQGCNDKKCHEIKKNHLADLEDKIESGELCDREEVRKETAREIIERLAKVEIVGEVRGELTFVVLRKDVETILADLGLEVDGK